MKRMSREVAMYLKAYNKTGPGLKDAADGLQKFSAGAMKIFAAIAKAGAAAIAGITTGAIAVGASFEQGMANTSSMFITAAKSAEELAGWTAQLSATARELGATTAFTAREATDAMYALASSGMDVTQVMEASSGVLKLAGATMTDMTSAAEITMSALKQFGLNADQTDRTVNVFAAGIQNSMLNMERLTNSMVYAGPVMASAGASIEETVAALGLLHNAGLKGSIAGTGLRMAILKIIKPSKDLAKVLGGVSLEEHGLAAVLERLKDANISTARLVAQFGPRAFGAIKALTNAGAEGMDKMTDAVTGTNAAMDMYDHQMDTAKNQWKILRSAMEETGLAIFDVIRDDLVESLKLLQEWVGKSREKFVELFKVIREGFDDATKTVAGVTEIYIGHKHAIDAIGVAAVGATVSLVAFSSALKAVAAIKAWAIIAAASGWVIALVAAIGALAAWIFKVSKQTGGWALEWERWKLAALEAFAWVSKGVLSFIVGFKGWMDAIGSYWLGVWNAAKDTFGEIMGDIGKALSLLPDMLWAALRGDKGAAEEAGKAIMDAFSGSASTIFKGHMIAVQTEYNLNMQYAKVLADQAGAEIDKKLEQYRKEFRWLQDKAGAAGFGGVPRAFHEDAFGVPGGPSVPGGAEGVPDVPGGAFPGSAFGEEMFGAPISSAMEKDTEKSLEIAKEFGDALGSTFGSTWDAITDRTRTGGQKWNDIFDNMKAKTWSALGSITKKFLFGDKERWKSFFATEKSVQALKTSGAALDTTVTNTKTANAATEQAANTGAAASGFFKAFSSIPFIGFGLAALAIGLMMKLLGGLKLAGGGIVSGPGGVDNVPAWLTNREYVMPVAQTQKYFPLLEAMRAGTFGFGEGGGLGFSAAAAAAGPVQPQVVVPVTFERGTLLVADDNLAVDRMADRILGRIESKISKSYRRTP